MTTTNATGPRFAALRRAATTPTPISRWVGRISLAAAALLITSQLLDLLLRLTLGDVSAAHPTYILKRGVALVAQYVLLLALTGLYARQSRAMGKLGLVAYLIASFGTVLVAGDWWFEAFMAPQIAIHAPQLFEVPQQGSVLVGAVATVGAFSLGWVLFGIATLRARLISIGPAILTISGGAVGILALWSPYQIPLAIAVGWMGYLLNTASQNDHHPTSG
jgi:hypothetical protein